MRGKVVRGMMAIRWLAVEIKGRKAGPGNSMLFGGQ
jgi:hypothetical protein